MLIQNYKFNDENEITDVIAAAEANYEAQICRAAEAASDHPELRFVILSGPTCSGKTTTASRLTDSFASYGRKIIVISIDDFYRDNNGSRSVDSTRKVDYESADAIDLEYFDECTTLIENGMPCSLPNFDFKTGKRAGYRPYNPHPEDVILFEGIQGVYPEIVSLLPADKLSRLYITVGEDITVRGIHFDRREVRLIRRIVRDYNCRNAEPDFTLFLWQHVVENEDKNILPRESSVPFHINSLLSYELNMIRDRFLFCVSRVKPSSQYYKITRELAGRMECLPPIDSVYLPEKSVFNEFIKLVH